MFLSKKKNKVSIQRTLHKVKNEEVKSYTDKAPLKFLNQIFFNLTGTAMMIFKILMGLLSSFSKFQSLILLKLIWKNTYGPLAILCVNGLSNEEKIE